MKALLLLFLIVASATGVAEAVEFQLWPWPDSAPGKRLSNSRTTDEVIRVNAGKDTITDVHEPTITFYRPESPNGTSVIVVPGGGYSVLSGVREAGQVCDWLNSLGVTGILLKYRTPTRDEVSPHEKPVQDAAKAIAMVRKHAKEWNLDPRRVGLLGIGAGGHLLARIACDRPAKRAIPDFGINIGGGGFVELWEPAKFKRGFTVPADAPPMFMACADDEGQTPIALTALYLGYQKHKISAELHLYSRDRHGFGMLDDKQPINNWPRRCAEWMTSMGWLPNVAVLDDEILKMETRVNTIFELSKKTTSGVECWVGFDRIPQYKERISAARKKGDTASQALVLLLEKQVLELEKGIAEAMKPRPLFDIEMLAPDIQMLRQKLADLRTKRDQLLDWRELPVFNPDARIAELEIRLVSLTEKLRPVCQDDVPILQRKMEQVNKDIEQAKKGENQSAVARLEMLRDEITKALADLTPRREIKIEDAAGQIAQVNAELTKLKAQRDGDGSMGGFMRAEMLKQEIKKREQGVENIVRVMQSRWRCGNDVDDAKRNLEEARKKLAATKQAGDETAAESAEETIRTVNAMFDELTKPVIDGVTIETISEDITRLKKEKIELEAELEILEFPPKTRQP